MKLVDLSGEVIRQSLGAIYNHCVAVCSTTLRDGNLAQRVTRLVSLLAQARNNADGGIVLVERRRKLLARAGQLLSEIICFECERIPLVLECRE